MSIAVTECGSNSGEALGAEGFVTERARAEAEKARGAAAEGRVKAGAARRPVGTFTAVGAVLRTSCEAVRPVRERSILEGRYERRDRKVVGRWVHEALRVRLSHLGRVSKWSCYAAE